MYGQVYDQRWEENPDEVENEEDEFNFAW